MKALDGISHQDHGSDHGATATDWRKSVSNHVAIALIVYTALNIFLTVEAIKDTGLRSLSMVCLIILIGGIIPACHKLEKRWRDMSLDGAQTAAADGRYRRDIAMLWLLALGLPFALTMIFRALA